ncbi:ABC transporter B family member 26, chloroplastic [Sesamum angolense]|uniref:ABC transporter B family member 26, chloroplastic n=1 Tax=Sesamum angolense TaxID=2727404 RepID=A0AAE2BYU1_9LAMI|nr:ABC transporter B family member 26, chloroplastic [Sesamum angolense]
MALPLCHLQPLSAFPLQPRKLPPKARYLNPHFNQEKAQIQFLASSKRFHYISAVKSASVNGYPLNKEDDNSFADSDKVELSEKLKKWVQLVREILPGGEWWKLSSEEVEDVISAKPVTVWRALKKMWELISQDRWVIFTAFVALIVTALSEISIPHYLTASIFSAKSSTIALFHQNVRLLVLLCITAGICSGVRGCLFGIANMILVKRLRERLYSTLLLQDISFFDSETVGGLTSRLGSDCQQVSRVIGNDLNLIMRNVLSGLRCFDLLADFVIATWTMCISDLHLSLNHYADIWPVSKEICKVNSRVHGFANDVAQETLSLMRTVRVYGTEKQELGRYKQWLDKLAGISLRQSAAYGFWNFSFNILYHSTQVIAVLIGGMSILSGHITAEQLTKFILYSEWLIYSTWWVGDNLSSLMQSIGASEKVFNLVDLSSSDQFTVKGLKLQKLMGRIEFVDVSFHYPSRKEVPVLQHFNLTVPPGEVVAIVGLSGSGKSTVVNLLLRLYEPQMASSIDAFFQLQILIDGYPMKELNVRWLRERIGYVGQEPRLFRMDISSNIKYGCPRDVSQQDVEWAAKQAFAHDFISSLPNGYQTLVDDDLLSGGQKQRIAIARAILRDPRILILDEATSALDVESEHNVKGVLRAVQSDLQARRTVIVIAHRLSTIQTADRIIVMDGGKIVEMGNHTELLRKDGLYARLIRRQADAVA